MDMFLQLFLILALTVFIVQFYMGTGFETAFIRSLLVFLALVVMTNITYYLIRIINQDGTEASNTESSQAQSQSKDSV